MAINPHRKGGTDVPVTDGGTDASDAPTALANLGGLDAAAHALIDHTGLPGVPPIGPFQTLDSTSDFAAINTALADANTRVVYLRPGAYTHPHAAITVPTGKWLVGLTGPAGDEPSEVPGSVPVLKPTTQGGPFITVDGDAVVKNLWISGVSGGPVNAAAFAISHAILAEPIWVENVFVRDWGFDGTIAAPAFNVGRGRFIHCTSVLGQGDGFNIGDPSGTQHGTIFENCQAYSNVGDGFLVTTGSGQRFLYCRTEQNGGDGFHITAATATHLVFDKCVAISNTLNGMNWSGASASDGCSADRCHFITNSLFGFISAVATGSSRAFVHGGTARGNVSGNYSVGAGWGSTDLTSAT